MSGFGFGFGFSPLGALLNQTPQHYYVNEPSARVAVRNTSFNGTVRMVGAGQTYSTITAAISAASSGDIIQLIDGTYDMKNEANGYLLLDAISKNLLLRGNIADPTAVILTQTVSSSFFISLYRTLDVRIESLTIAQTKDGVCVYCDWNTASIYHAFKNVIFTNTSTNSLAGFYRLGDTNYHAAVSRIEFENCTFTKSTAATLFQFARLGANVQILFTSPTFNISNCINISITALHTCKVAVYDGTFNQATDDIVFQFGNDTIQPEYILGIIDLRNNTLSYSTGKGNHAILLGRGVVNCCIVNNRVTVYKQDVGNIGIVLKTIAASVGDCIIAGNIVTAYRPLLIKGSSKNKIRYNTCISNDASNTFGGIEAENTTELDGLITSTGNVVTNNNLFGKGSGFIVSTELIDPLMKTSVQSWTVDYNKYYSINGNFAYDGSTHQLATRETFWTGSATNDDNSKMVDSAAYEISAELKDV